MPKQKNKIKYGLKNVYYAAITETDGGISYGTPIRIPGAVSVSLTPQGEMSEFHADDTVYFKSATNTGYEGDLEIAVIPDSFRVDVLNETLNETDKVLIERADVLGKPFALLFEFAGDSKAIRHQLCYCTAARPNIASSTKTNTIEPNTDALTISAMPRADGVVKISTTVDTPDETYNGWFTNVWDSAGPGNIGV